METEIEVPAARPSLQLLNEYCLLEIFEFLDMDDSINLAKTSSRLRFVADRIFKIRSKLVRVDSKMINKGEKYIDHLFQHIGRHVISLGFHCGHRNLSKILGNVSNKCKNLKDLKCCGFFCGTMCDGGVQPAYSFDNVELLTLEFCTGVFTEYFTKSFFESFHRLKAVIIIHGSIESHELKTIFQNNRNIESFYFNGNHRKFNCQLLELIPNVERLSLTVISPSAHTLDSLLKLNRLTKLRLSCHFKNVKNVLRELATKGLIEELDLDLVELGEDFFDTLASFSKLQLFVLHTRAIAKLKSSISWPAQLKKLRLVTFELTKNDLIAMIQQLERIECIDIEHCIIAKDDIHNFSDFAKLSQEICNIVDHSNRKQRLDVVLPESLTVNPSKTYLVESERLRVMHYQRGVRNPLGINIHFPRFIGGFM